MRIESAHSGSTGGVRVGASGCGDMLRRLSSIVVNQAWLRKVALTTPFVRDMAWHFVAGESLDAGLTVLRALNALGMSGTLNHVGTHVRSEAEAIAAAGVALESLRRIHDERLDSNLSLKLTQIGLDVDEALCREQLHRILDRASQLGNFVCIDMEESPYVERTLRLFEAMRGLYGADTVGVALQSYLRNHRGDLGRLLAGGSRVRLVKGGYWEPAGIAFRRKADIDGAFREDMQLLLRRGQHPAIATHDPRAVAQARRMAVEARLDRRAFEFQMLFGVAGRLRDDLVREGYAVRCYVPYGRGWYEYFLGCARRVPGGALRQLSERFRPHRM